MYTLNLADKEAGSFSQRGQLQIEYEPTSEIHKKKRKKIRHSQVALVYLA